MKLNFMQLLFCSLKLGNVMYTSSVIRMMQAFGSASLTGNKHQMFLHTALYTYEFVASPVPAMKREPPDDDAPWKENRKRPKLPQPVATRKQHTAKASVPEAAIKKEESLMSFRM